MHIFTLYKDFIGNFFWKLDLKEIIIRPIHAKQEIQLMKQSLCTPEAYIYGDIFGRNISIVSYFII